MNSFLKFLGKNKLYAFIEALGLVVSLTFVILIGSYVWQQYDVAHENPDGDRIYGLGRDDLLAMSWWDKESLDSIPGVESITRIGDNGGEILKFSDKIVMGLSCEIDSNFFSIFNYKILEGDLQDFQSGGAVLVSRRFASMIDDGNGVVGRTIGRTVGEEDGTPTYKDYVIGGIVEDLDNTLVMYYDIFFSAAKSSYATDVTPFQSYGSHLSVIKRKKEVDEQTFKDNIFDKCYQNYTFFKKENNDFKLYNYSQMYFHKASYMLRSADKTLLALLTIVVLLLLASAIINYVNLNVALVRKRSREMATRRLHGATRGSVAWKYISESLVFTAVCFLLAIVLAYLLVPFMNSLLSGNYQDGQQVVGLRFILDFKYVAAYVLAVLVFGTLAGLLPALEASRTKPIDIIRGTYARRSRMLLGKFFIVFQNIISVVLIALALVMEMQMKHLMQRPMNFTSDNLFVLAGPSSVDKMRLFEEKLRKLPFVEEIGYGRGFPGNINWSIGRKKDVGGETREVNLNLIGCDSTYFRLLGFKVLEDFNRPLSNSLWLSQTAYRAAGFTSDEEASNFARTMRMNNMSADYVGGIFEDTPADRVEASEDNGSIGVLVQYPENLHYACDPLIKVSPTVDKDYAEKAIMDAYKEYMEEAHGFSNEPYMKGFLSDILNRKMASAVNTMRLLELFMVLAVMISLLGLLAMSTYYSAENTKQIAVRKVFGSDVRKETIRSVKEYIVLVFIAIIIGLPIAWYLSQRYLEQYSYRITGVVLPLAAAVVITLVFASASVLWQVLKSAKANPAVELKKD